MKSLTSIASPSLASLTPATALAALAATVALAALAPRTAAADPGSLAGDVEVDPTAYILDGSSLHAGLARGHLRLDLGVYAMALPQAAHGDDGFDVAFDGFGAKLQWFPRASRTGVFVGVDAGVARVRAHRQGTDLTVVDRQVSTGVHVGYRFALPANLYVTPWLGVGRAWGAEDLTVDGATYEAMPVTVFPAVHLGYRFE